MTKPAPHSEVSKRPHNTSIPVVDPNTATSAAEESQEGIDSLKYSLLGPSLLKAGQDKVDQNRVSRIIYNASKGSKFFAREEERDRQLTLKIEAICAKKARLTTLDLTRDLRNADNLLSQLSLSRDLTQSIVHVDCDAFYASVELLDRPELAHLPFCVGGGVLTTCNYIARKFGVRSGMAGFVAKKLCPQLIFLPMSPGKYSAKANEVREVLAEYDPRFESASIDEAYLNITEYCTEHGLGRAEAVEKMRREIHERTMVTVSAGIAANARLAKICSDRNKPNGQFELANDKDEIMAFMRELPTRQVNGVGRVFERELAAVGIKTCGDVYEERRFVNQLFGEKAYEFLMRVYLGLGRTNVQPAEEYERKSVSTESTFSDMSDPVKLREKLRSTAGELEKDMRKAECKGRTLCLKVKMHTFEVLTRQVVTPKAVSTVDDFYGYALPMLVKLEQEFPRLTIRLLGLKCTHLVSAKKPDTLAFFGLKKRTGADGTGVEQSSEEAGGSGSGARKRKAEYSATEEWETWPEEEFAFGQDGGSVSTALPGPGDKPQSPPLPAQPDSDPTHDTHGKEAASDPIKGKEEKKEEKQWFECPICRRPQSTDERQLNEHIDLCLSRQAIRDTVQESHQQVLPPPVPRSLATPEAKRTRTSGNEGRKRGGKGSGGGHDPRQRKLFFGAGS